MASKHCNSKLLNFPFLKNIYSKVKRRDFIEYCICGIKIKKKHSLDKKLMTLFEENSVLNKTILIVELNACHYETIPGLCYLLKKIGYNVEVLIIRDSENIFQDKDEMIKLWNFNIVMFDYASNNCDFKKYDRIIYNSRRLYIDPICNSVNLLEYRNNLPQGKKENVYLEHHLDFLNKDTDCNYIVLANPAKHDYLESHVVNAHNFNDVKITDKSSVTNFISVGELSTKRRNSAILVNAVYKIHKMGIRNFTVTIVGRGDFGYIPTEIQPYFNIMGRLDYLRLFSELEKADFILSLLDPEIKSHKRYMDAGTSGTFQLVYGFLKPCLLHKTFANIYDFNETNAIIYDKNEDLEKSMLDAINLSSEKYKDIQENLKLKVQKIEQQSVANLKRILND